MRASGSNRLLCVLGLGLAVTGAAVFFWLFPLKLLARLAARLGVSSPCPASLSWLVDNAVRRRYMASVLARVGIQPGERVLELGPGPGAFTLEAARHVGEAGRLIAVDIQPAMMAQVQDRVRRAGLSNVHCQVASAHRLPLEDGRLDRAFLITVLPEIPDPARALAELRRVLKPGGMLSITEEFFDPDYLLLRETVRLAGAAGFHFVERFGSFWVYTANFQAPGGM